jgi:hypothetical protein
MKVEGLKTNLCEKDLRVFHLKQELPKEDTEEKAKLLLKGF